MTHAKEIAEQCARELAPTTWIDEERDARTRLDELAGRLRAKKLRERDLEATHMRGTGKAWDNLIAKREEEPTPSVLPMPTLAKSSKPLRHATPANVLRQSRRVAAIVGDTPAANEYEGVRGGPLLAGYVRG